MLALSKAEKFKAAITVTVIAAVAWAIDALTKYIALTALADKPNHAAIGIKYFLYFVLGTNYGGSNGLVSPQFAEFCLAIPAVIMFLAAMWVGRQLRRDKPITLLQQIGFGLFLGGALANWAERVLYHGVTDFIFLQPVGFCIFNLADIFIDLGYTTLIAAFAINILRSNGNLQAKNSSAKNL